MDVQLFSNLQKLKNFDRAVEQLTVRSLQIPEDPVVVREYSLSWGREFKFCSFTSTEPFDPHGNFHFTKEKCYGQLESHEVSFTIAKKLLYDQNTLA